MAFLRVAIMAALVTLATPVAAGEAEVVRTTSIPVKVEGSVQVEFTSSTAAGCVGPCNVSGSLTWAPAGEADLTVSDNRFPGRRELSASLFFLGGAEQDGPTTTAHVVRDAPGGTAGVCSDARVASLTFLDFSAGSSSQVEARLLRGRPDDSGLFRTRCGGPIESDLVTALPSATLDRATLERGGTTVDLSGTRPFAANGFAGTALSSIKLRLGRPRNALTPSARSTARQPPAYAPRTVIAVYQVERVAGTIVTSFTGGAEQSVCAPLDTCGASGSVRLTPLVSSGRATFAAYGPARRVSGRDLRAALGLRPGPRAPSITASGVADWNRDLGSAAESFTDGDGAACSDTLPLAGGFITFWVGPRRVFATYGRGSGAGLDPLRTRCPGPSIADAAEGHALATGSVPRAAFHRRRVVITLSRGRTFQSQPYAGQTQPSLQIVLRRKRVSETLGFEGLGGIG